jgi:predicted Zn-dependent protease with MMP-like domain
MLTAGGIFFLRQVMTLSYVEVLRVWEFFDKSKKIKYNFFMDDEEFEKLINHAIGSLPKELLEKLENVSIVIADWPSSEQLLTLKKGGQGGLLLGLYEGIPQTRRGRYGIGTTLPDKITLFKIPLLKISKSYDGLKENVRNTVLHEIGHHFGMSEEAIKKASERNLQS